MSSALFMKKCLYVLRYNKIVYVSMLLQIVDKIEIIFLGCGIGALYEILKKGERLDLMMI